MRQAGRPDRPRTGRWDPSRPGQTVSWAPPTSSVRLKILREHRVRAAERVRKLERVQLAPAPARGIAAVAVGEAVDRGAQRVERELVPGAADQLLIALGPEFEQVRLPAPGRADVGEEAVVRAVEPALGEVAITDHGAGELARQPQRERLVDRRRDRVRRHPPVPAAQALDRRRSRWSRGRSRASRCAVSRPGSESMSVCMALKAVEIVLVGGGEDVLDPARPVAVELVADDVMRGSPRE